MFTQKRLCVASFFHRANARQRGKTKFFRAAALRTRKTWPRNFFPPAAPTRRRGKLPDISKNHNPHFHDIEFTYEIILKKLSRNRKTCGIIDKNMAVNYLISQVADSWLIIKVYWEVSLEWQMKRKSRLRSWKLSFVTRTSLWLQPEWQRSRCFRSSSRMLGRCDIRCQPSFPEGGSVGAP